MNPIYSVTLAIQSKLPPTGHHHHHESAFMSMDYPRQEAHKVATLTLAEAKIQASYANETSGVEGSLGGLNLCDLTPACGR